jgi:hypothetical protein
MTDREEFEALMRERGEDYLYRRDSKFSLHIGEYCRQNVQDQWEIWQAARATAEQSVPYGELETMMRLEISNAQLSRQVQMLKRTASGPELLERLAASQKLEDVSNGQWAEIHKDLAEKTLAQVREILTDSTIPHVAARVCRALEKIDLIIPNADAAIESQQDAAIESKQADQRSLGDVTGAMYRCRRCGETSEIQFNYATLQKEDVCCRQHPCVRPGNGPCDMPARDTKLSATHQSLLVRLAALKRYRNKLKSTGEPSGNYATLSVPIVLLEAIDAAIESQLGMDRERDS